MDGDLLTRDSSPSVMDKTTQGGICPTMSQLAVPSFTEINRSVQEIQSVVLSPDQQVGWALAWSDLVFFFSIFEMLASPDLDIIFLIPKPQKNKLFFECKYILLLMAFLKFRNSQGA